MRKNLLYLAMVALAGLSLTSCSEDDLDPKSIIVTTQTNENDFDKWLKANFVNPYNIEVAYRYEDIESDMNYYAVPADYDQAVELAHIVKYTCVEAYNEVAGVDFTRAWFPKRFQLSGVWEYRNNGTIILGTAEGGKKIFLYGVNFLDQYVAQGGIEALNTYYLKTIHHEFTHILNQTKEYSADYQQITGATYLADDWSTEEGGKGFESRGYISAYSQHSHQEDFAEMLSEYVTHTPEQWEDMLYQCTKYTVFGKDKDGNDLEEHFYGDEPTSADLKDAQFDLKYEYSIVVDDKTGRALINSKLAVVRDYMSSVWGIDIDELRESVINREMDVLLGKVDLKDLTVN